MAAGECELCNAGGAILKNRLAYARPEHRPLGPGHMIVVPFRHVAGYFEMTLEEKQAVACSTRRNPCSTGNTLPTATISA